MSTEPMDVYSSSLDIPFEVAAYCRGHKFAPEAVYLAKAIRERAVARIKVRTAETNLQDAQDVLEDAMKDIRAKMERNPT